MGKGSRRQKVVAGFDDIRMPGWLPPLLFGVVTLVLFRKFVFSGEMLHGSDTISLGYMARAFFADALRSGTFPFWNPIILGGTPFLESLAGGDLRLDPISRPVPARGAPGGPGLPPGSLHGVAGPAGPRR